MANKKWNGGRGSLRRASRKVKYVEMMGCLYPTLGMAAYPCPSRPESASFVTGTWLSTSTASCRVRAFTQMRVGCSVGTSTPGCTWDPRGRRRVGAPHSKRRLQHRDRWQRLAYRDMKICTSAARREESVIWAEPVSIVWTRTSPLPQLQISTRFTNLLAV